MSEEHASSSAADTRPYQFGDITLDPQQRSVRRRDAQISLGKLSYELLLLLVRNAPRVVAHEQVADVLWAGRPVTVETVRQRVKLLRRALSDNSVEPQYFRVVRGHGYQLIPQVVRLPSEPSPARRCPPILIAASIAIACAVIFVALYLGMDDAAQQTVYVPREVSTRTVEQSVAVLPFENVSGDPNDAPLVDGIHGDILSQLFKIGRIKVISRTSVRAYEGSTKPLRQIGQELDVATILEGSVQRVDDAIRINVRLIDAQSDEQLWAEGFDRPISARNILDIQSEIAASIAETLHAALSTEEAARLSIGTTDNMRAYGFYLIGESHWREVDNNTAFGSAAEAYQHAVEEDPNFAIAWARLASARSSVYFLNGRDSGQLNSAREAVETAFRLAPNLPEAHLARGFYNYHGVGDYPAALREWELAELGLAGDARLYAARAFVYRRMGQFDRAAINWARAISLDPRNIKYLFTQHTTVSVLRRHDDARQIAERVVEIVPDDPVGYYLRAKTALRSDGDFDEARTMLASAPIDLPPEQTGWLAHWYARDVQTVLAYLDGWDIDADNDPFYFAPKDFYYGLTYELGGQPGRASVAFERARERVERELTKHPHDPRMVIAMAEILAHQHERDEALRRADEAMSLLPTSADAFSGPPLLLNVAFVRAAAGNADGAIAALDDYLQMPAVWTIEGLIPEPRLDPIRDDRRFADLAQRYGRP